MTSGISLLISKIISRTSGSSTSPLIPAVEVAKVVWEAYHTDKIHWYVPPELAEFDALATASPEAVRDQMALGGVLRVSD